VFNGFSQETIDFFFQLRENNNKEWFHAHREEYQKYVREPFKALVNEMGPMMLSIDTQFEIDSRRTISRINRDIRYTRDKSPYRANMWITFKRLSLDWKTEPVFFFEIFPEYYRYGMGYYITPRSTMDEIRSMMDREDERFTEIRKLYKSQDVFTIEGAKYKRLFNKEQPEDLKEWYRRKELIFVCKRMDDLIFKPQLIDVMYNDFKLIEPIYHFLSGLKHHDSPPFYF
jgi:uncharacterized protein (TIGR02453 family)